MGTEWRQPSEFGGIADEGHPPILLLYPPGIYHRFTGSLESGVIHCGIPSWRNPLAALAWRLAYRVLARMPWYAHEDAQNTSSANVTGANEALVEESVEALQRIQLPKRSSAK